MEGNAFWQWWRVWDVLPDLLTAFVEVTLVVTVVGSLLAAVIGLVIAVIRYVAPKPVKMVVTFFVNFVRMTPIIPQLVFASFMFTELSLMTIGIVIFGIHYATYMAEVYRAGIDSVPKGQWEATTALSMPAKRVWIAVVVPQALRATIPALGNYVISMFKDTPFLYAIGVIELVRAAQMYGGSHFRYTEAITMAGIIFLVASYPTSLLIARLEKRLVYAS